MFFIAAFAVYLPTHGNYKVIIARVYKKINGNIRFLFTLL